ncbi:MAG: polysaccharide biosynthesis/export family protein [Bacteroidales bacterium]|nr:polysaccharide biosynthesis/export family protein [Bacteroidales bacterium]
MKQNRKYFHRRMNAALIMILFTAIGLLSSCVTQQEVEYLQDPNKGTRTFNEAQIEDYRLKPYDELYIQITSLDDASSNMFSGAAQQQFTNAGSLQPYGASLVSYGIDKDGFLILPMIGTVNVKDQTILQVSKLLKDSLVSILNQPIVSVKLVNRYISVLGEVRSPGHFALAQEKLTVYDALGLAGDINEYGNKKEVILTRNEDGKNIRVALDLTKSEILASNYYYMKPNDMLYIKPMRKKFWGMREFPFSVVLTTISTALLIYSVTK